jgi:hypothetical protein
VIVFSGHRFRGLKLDSPATWLFSVIAIAVVAGAMALSLRSRSARPPAPPPTPAGPLRVVASDDGWIDLDQPLGVHGRDALLLAGAKRYVAYIRFVPTTTAPRARLRVRVARAGSGSVHRCMGADWREATLDQVHAPSLGRGPIGRFARVEAGADLVVDIGPLPVAEPLTLAITGDDDGLALASHESATPPVLELEPATR